ncbi:hypothetical protein [Flavobacterium nitrogenifigens]|uniref:Uncharacterized protein n=1 Tax=Flavobacterium nitrogenifigens TaxID=1617283 RepID=A0A521BSA6_9FLAO|nr:hypothetical protein [Flavobacterium nitrogenifigens]KAF2337671.1 hypothetical protein DM397_04255 [Flavobacterium nitrogenifigens]SMO49935.1 hypothetical protein SAMN06265220_1011316 [Flavobacterium nitrogenifigens]
MDSKIIVRILIVGLTTVLSLTIFTEKDFMKEVLSGWTDVNDSGICG